MTTIGPLWAPSVPFAMAPHPPVAQDIIEVRVSHDNAVVISLTIANYNVKRILVDNRSLADILYYDVFQKIKLPYSQLQPISAPLVRFTGSSVLIEGVINLPVTIETELQQRMVKLTFLMVRCPRPTMPSLDD